ncbi:MAG: phage repressor protein [Xanthobacteraceae bacterium]
MNLGEVLERIERRLAALDVSADAASRAARKPDAIRNIRRAVRSGDRHGVSTTTLAALAPVLKTSAAWLVEGVGEEDADERTVPVVGYVGAGAAIYHHDAQGPFEHEPAPDGSTESTVAVIIKGDSLGSLFEDWLVFYDDVRAPVTSDLIGKLCVVGLADGRVFVKRLTRSKGGLFHLIGQFGDPILDVEVEWAARVKHMVPR